MYTNEENLKYINFFTKDKEISFNRLIGLLYLTDWFNCILNDKKLTTFNYEYQHSHIKIKGLSKLLSYDDLIIKENIYDKVKNDGKEYKYTENELKLLDFVVDKTKDKYGMELFDYMCSTYPIQAPYRNTMLDLEKLSIEYKELENQKKENDFEF